METNVTSIATVVKDFTAGNDLENVLEIAEGVLSLVPIPGLPLIIKILKFLVKCKPLANKGADVALSVSGSVGCIGDFCGYFKKNKKQIVEYFAESDNGFC